MHSKEGRKEETREKGTEVTHEERRKEKGRKKEGETKKRKKPENYLNEVNTTTIQHN